MGHNLSKKEDLDAELDFLAKETGMEKQAVQDMYESFASKKGVNKKEFVSAYSQFFPKAVAPDPIAKTLFKNCDTDEDGTISFSEFAIVMYFLTQAPKEEKLKRIFKLLDMNGSGTLSSREIVQLVKHAYDVRGQLNFDYNVKGIQIFRLMDKDGDMRVNCQEFVKACLADAELSQLLEDLVSPISCISGSN